MTGAEILQEARTKYPNRKFHLNDKETLLGVFDPETCMIYPIAGKTIINDTWMSMHYWPMINGEKIEIRWNLTV